MKRPDLRIWFLLLLNVFSTAGSIYWQHLLGNKFLKS